MSTEKDYLLTVHPTTEANWYNGDVRTEGLLLRDYFAAKAAQGFLAGAMADGTTFSTSAGADVIATTAYLVADAMLKARNN